MPKGQVNPIVRAVGVLRKLTPEQFKLAVTLARPETPAPRKKPGPKPGYKKAQKQEARAPKAAKRIEAETE